MHTTAFFRTRFSDSAPASFPRLRSWWGARRSRAGVNPSHAALAKGRLQRIGIAAGTVLVCERGTLWITDASGWEAVLEAGESRIFSRDADLLAEALAPAAFTLRAGEVPG